MTRVFQRTTAALRPLQRSQHFLPPAAAMANRNKTIIHSTSNFSLQTTTTHNPFIHRLIQELYDDPSHSHTHKSSPTHHRNKISYDFDYLRSNSPSQLAQPIINSICQSLLHFSMKKQFSNVRWYDMIVQKSRSQNILIKFTVNTRLNPQISQELIDFLCEKHENENEKIETIVYQIASFSPENSKSSRKKPSKTDPYYILKGNGRLTHITPFSRLETYHSANSFIETNEEMEDIQFRYFHKWIQPILRRNCPCWFLHRRVLGYEMAMV